MNRILGKAQKYVGIPYKTKGKDKTGFGCFGLVNYFFKEEFNIDLFKNYFNLKEDVLIKLPTQKNKTQALEDLDILIFKAPDFLKKTFVFHCGIFIEKQLFHSN